MSEHRYPAEYELRQEMIRVGRLLWERGYVAATDGNLSARLGPDRLLATATGVSKGFLSPDNLLVLDLEGRPAGGYRGRGQKPSSEILVHLEVYRQRPDAAAVIHAHPPLATAFSIAGVSLARCVIPEVIVGLGSIVTTDYATPGTGEVPPSIRQAIQHHEAIIMAHHGSLTLGTTLWEAYLRLEKVEHTAQITLAAHQLGRVGTLSPEAVERLAQIRRERLQKEGRDACQDCTLCVLDSDPAEEELVQTISRAVLKNLHKGENIAP